MREGGALVSMSKGEGATLRTDMTPCAASGAQGRDEVIGQAAIVLGRVVAEEEWPVAQGAGDQFVQVINQGIGCKRVQRQPFGVAFACRPDSAFGGMCHKDKHEYTGPRPLFVRAGVDMYHAAQR